MRIISIVMACFLSFGVFASEEAADPAKAGQPKIIMEPFNFALIKKGRVQGQVTVELVLVVSDMSKYELVHERMPQLRADFLAALTSLSSQRFSTSRPVDPDLVSAYLTPYAERRLEHGAVEIFVQQAMVKPR